MLKIRYLFRDAVHEVTYGDEEPVRIPKQCEQLLTVLHFVSVCVGFFSERYALWCVFWLLFFTNETEARRRGRPKFSVPVNAVHNG